MLHQTPSSETPSNISSTISLSIQYCVPVMSIKLCACYIIYTYKSNKNLSSLRINSLAKSLRRIVLPAGILHFVPELNVYKVLFYIACSDRNM